MKPERRIGALLALPRERPIDRFRRISAGEAGRLAIADRRERFPVVSDANVDEALAYQEERIRYHLERLEDV